MGKKGHEGERKWRERETGRKEMGELEGRNVGRGNGGSGDTEQRGTGGKRTRAEPGKVKRA